MVPIRALTDDLEEALLFEFEGADESASLTPKHTTVTSSLVSAAASAGSMRETGSLPSLISSVRSITKDSGGTHVLTENFTLHIEEVGWSITALMQWLFGSTMPNSLLLLGCLVGTARWSAHLKGELAHKPLMRQRLATSILLLSE
jgi:hypothetical protein